MEQYQDEWVNGQRVSKGVRECEHRYEVIKNFCKKFNRPFSVIDIGANIGYFSIRLMEDFDCCCVMMEGRDCYHDNLVNNIVTNGCKKPIVLHKWANHDILDKLTRCEHFDLVLGMSIAHHFAGNINSTIEKLKNLGDHTLLELPFENNACGQPNVKDIVVSEDWNVIGKGLSHLQDGERNIYHIESKSYTILDKRYGYHVPSHQIKISSDFKSKTVSFPHKKEKDRPWIHGINLFTFKALNGTYPTVSHISKQINSLLLDQCPEGHGDIRPWNIVMDGDSLLMIDKNQWKMPNDLPLIKEVKKWLNDEPYTWEP